MAKMVQNKKHAMFAVLISAVLFNLSNVPGASQTFGSAELLSQGSFLSNCSFDTDIRDEGISQCNITRNKIASSVTIEKMKREEAGPKRSDGTPGPVRNIEEYKVTSTIDEAGFCADGSCSVTRTAKTIEEAKALGLKLTEELTKEARAKAKAEKERLARIEKCEVDEDGEEIKGESKILKCLADKMKELDPDKQADYYADNMKERIQALLTSNSPRDRALGMGALGEIGKNMNINCATRPGLQQQAAGSNPLLNQANLNPGLNPMRPVNTAGSRAGAARDLIAESTCDMWAFGSYNNNVEYLRLAAAQPNANRQALNHAMKTLKGGWGQYFQQRGLALQADPLGLSGMSSSLYDDVLENNEKLNANMQSVIDRHKDLMQPIAPAQTADQQAAAGRMARGGIQPQSSNGGTPAVTPWSAAPNAPAAPSVNNRPAQQVAPNAGRFMGAPRMGTMGTQSVGTAPGLRR